MTIRVAQQFESRLCSENTLFFWCKSTKMNCKITLALAVLAVVMVSIQAVSLTKRQAVEERPETPLLQVCEEPGIL